VTSTAQPRSRRDPSSTAGSGATRSRRKTRLARSTVRSQVNSRAYDVVVEVRDDPGVILHSRSCDAIISFASRLVGLPRIGMADSAAYPARMGSRPGLGEHLWVTARLAIANGLKGRLDA
jgi:hypothetical protein